MNTLADLLNLVITTPTFPHHFHTAAGRVEPSPLTGDPARDLVIVLDHLSDLARG